MSVVVLPGGFCFRCNTEYEEMMHDCPKKWDPKFKEPDMTTPEYRKYLVKHRSNEQKKLAKIFKALGDARSFIREMMFPDNPEF